MKKVIWLSANVFGFELLKHVQTFAPGSINKIVTLDEESKTVMYDGVDKSVWDQFKIPVLFVKDGVGLEEVVKSEKPDLIFMCGWRQIIPESVLVLPKNGVIGFHPTLLPKGRGPAPIINSIMEGFTDSGISMFYVANLVDAGDIVGQERFKIELADTSEDLYHKIIKAGCVLMEKFLPKILTDTAPRVPQDDTQAIYFAKRSLKDNEIFESDSPEIIDRKIRALSWPYNGAFVRVGNKKLIVKKGEIFYDEK